MASRLVPLANEAKSFLSDPNHSDPDAEVKWKRIAYLISANLLTTSTLPVALQRIPNILGCAILTFGSSDLWEKSVQGEGNGT